MTTTATALRSTAAEPPFAPPEVEVVVPVYNEFGTLDQSIRRLHGYLDKTFPFSFRVTIADNASTDGTWDVARSLADELHDVRAVRLDAKGRGRALDAVWSTSDARVLAYMDVDLSTDLAALLPLVAPLLSGHSDLAIGSRLTRGAKVVRGPKRELISRCYNALLQLVLGARFSDAQCGFKAIRADRARQLLPLVRRPRVVLRHRAARAGRAAPGCGSTRFRSTGSTIQTRASTSSRRRWPTCAA